MSSTYMIFRYAFSIVNLFFFLFALAIVACSWTLHLRSDDYASLLANRWFTAPVILIVSAKFAIFLGILGCLGAWFEKKALLFLYILTMVLLFIILLVGVVFTIAVNERKAVTVRNDLLENIRQAKDEENPFRRLMNPVQRRLQCCGIDDYQDWYIMDAWPGQNPTVPDSCCLDEKPNCGKDLPLNETSSLIYTEGCFDRIQREINRNLMIVGILAFVLVFIEGICIIAALGILCYLRQRDSYI